MTPTEPRPPTPSGRTRPQWALCAAALLTLAGCAAETDGAAGDTADASDALASNDTRDANAADTIDCSTPTLRCPCDAERDVPCCYNTSMALVCITLGSSSRGLWDLLSHSTECEWPFEWSFCPHWAHSE